MKKYVLNYYSFFKCALGECKHTCCAGWEMNIDEQTLGAYKNNNSGFSERLKKGVNFRKSSFKSDKNGRCAFLNKNGLCEIIINLGEQSLCQVCRDHPRFRSYFNDRVEMGLGFCCEQATKVILSFKDKIEPVLVSDGGNTVELDFNQKNVLEFREKALSIIHDRNVDINQRINNLLSLCNAQIEYEDFTRILKTYLSLERLNNSWTVRLKNLKKKVVSKSVDANLTHYIEQFLVNSLYRHLYDAEDTYSVRARTIACVLGWWLIESIFEQEREKKDEDFNLLVDVIREYSAEVEYSQKNIDKLFSLAYKFIKI